MSTVRGWRRYQWQLSLGVTMLSMLPLVNCELVQNVDRSGIGDGSGGSGGDTSTGGATGGDTSSGGSAASGGSTGGSNSTGGSSSTGGAESTGGSGPVNTCPDAMGGALSFDAPAIEGTYNYGTDDSNTFDAVAVIGDTVWLDGDGSEFAYFYSSVDNSNKRIIAQNAATDTFFGCKWSRFVWFEKYDSTTMKDELYFCQDVYDAETELDAINASSTVNTGDLSAGCVGAGWYHLKPN